MTMCVMILRTVIFCICITKAFATVHQDHVVSKITEQEKLIYSSKEGLKVKSHFGNDINGFYVDMKSKDAVGHNAIYYGHGRVFLNIPYVKRITKNRRYRLPVRLTKIEEKQELAKRNNCEDEKTSFKNFGPKCRQFGNPETSEDCLTINVIAPKGLKTNNHDKEKNLHPVYIHIHGGALVLNGAADIGYRGLIRNFASQGIVVVTFNYRLGAYGFLEIFNEKEFTSPQPKGLKHKLPTNYRINLGLEDSILALDWVRLNIKNFGGNPKKITVGGDSAGGTIIETLILNGRNQKFNFQGVALLGGTADLCTENTFLKQNLDKKRKNAYCSGKEGYELWNCLTESNEDLTKLDGKNGEIVFWGIKTPDVGGSIKDVARGAFDNYKSIGTGLKWLMFESADEWSLFDSISINAKITPKGKPHSISYLEQALNILLKPYEDILKIDGTKFVTEQNVNKIAKDLVETYKKQFEKELGWPELPNEQLTEVQHYKIHIQAMTHMLWSTRMLENALKYVKNKDTVYMIRFAHKLVDRYGWPTPFNVDEDHARVVDHNQETRFGLMGDKHWKQTEFQNAHELTVADSMAITLANFIHNGNPVDTRRETEELKQSLPSKCLACAEGALQNIWPCLKPSDGNNNGPHYYKLSSKHPKSGIAEKIKVKLDEMEEWMSGPLIKYWCDFYKKHGQTPFTVRERQDNKVDGSAHFALCELVNTQSKPTP